MFDLRIVELSSFLITSLSFLKSTGTGIILWTSNLSTLVFKLFTPIVTFSNISISNLSTSDFKLSKSTFLVHFDVLTSVASLKSAFLKN